MLHRYGASGGAAEEGGTDSQTLWAWTAALIQLKKHGLKSTKTKAAIQAAIGVNPSVYPLLVQDKVLRGDSEVRAGKAVRSFVLHNGRRVSPDADEHDAERYIQNYRKHWWQADKHDDKVLLRVRHIGEETYLTCKHERESLFMGSKGGAAAEGCPSVRLPQRSTTSCAHCNALAGGDVKIQACGKCKQVGYCSKRCQTNSWKLHKKLSSSSWPGLPSESHNHSRKM